MLKTSRDFYVQAKDACGQAVVEGRIAEMYLRQGDFDRAQTLLEQGRQFWQRLNHARWTASFTARLARLACYQGRFGEALVWTEESLAGYVRAPAPMGTAYALCCRAHALRGLQEGKAAAAALSEALEVWNRAGYLKGITEGLEIAARLALEERDWQTAAGLLGKAAALRAQMGLPLPPAEEETHTWMRNVITARKNWKQAWTEGEQREIPALLKSLCPPLLP